MNIPGTNIDNGANTYATIGGGRVVNGAPVVANNIPGASSSTPVANQEYATPIGPQNSPTVLTDANIHENIVPDVKTQVKDLNTPANGNTNTGNIGTGNSNPVLSEGEVIPDGVDANSYDTLYKSLFGAGSDAIDNSPETKAAADAIATLKPNDAESQSAFSSILSNYNTLATNLKASQATQTDKVQNALLLGVSARYAPVSSSGILTAKAAADTQALADLQNKENTAIATATKATQDQNYRYAQAQLAEVKDIRSQKLALAKNINSTLSANNKAIATSKIQAAKDESIATLLGQGITDPSELLNELNKDAGGAQSGTFTSKDVATALKNLAPGGDTSKLTGAIGEYFRLKEADVPLPPEIASLPENEQPYAYVRYKAALDRKASTTSTHTPGGYSFSNGGKGKLISSGLTSDQIQHLQDGINQYGLNEVLTQESGLTPAQADVLRSEYAGTKSSGSTDDALTF